MVQYLHGAKPRKFLSDQSCMAKKILPPNHKIVRFFRSILVTKPVLNLQNLQSMQWSEVSSERDFRGLHCSLAKSTVNFHPKLYSICNGTAKKLPLLCCTNHGWFISNQVHNGILDVISDGFMEVSLRYKLQLFQIPTDLYISLRFSV